MRTCRTDPEIVPGLAFAFGAVSYTHLLLANIVLNELDWWVESQWADNPVAVARGRNDKGTYYASLGYNDSPGAPITTEYKRHCINSCSRSQGKLNSTA